jgi:NAD(P)H-dependent FMN reductase
MDPIELKLVVGSTRPGRGTDVFLPWLVERTEAHGRFAVDVLDLREWDLPMFQETWDSATDGYSHERVRRWNETVVAGEAFLLVTPEYNHSVPAVLKNAIDSVFLSNGFRNKPTGFVGYSGGVAGGVRAVEHLASIVIEAESVPLRNAVLLAQYHRAFEEGAPTDPLTEVALTILLDDLAWWGDALRRARAEGQLPIARERRVA